MGIGRGEKPTIPSSKDLLEKTACEVEKRGWPWEYAVLFENLRVASFVGGENSLEERERTTQLEEKKEQRGGGKIYPRPFKEGCKGNGGR